MWRKSFAAVFLTVFAMSGQEKAPEPARLEGTVVDAVSGKPIRKAAIVVRQERTLDFGYVALTDEAGHFELTGLPAGSWVGQVQRDGYVTLGSFEGGSTPKELRWRIAPGAVFKDLTFRLTPTGVITGRVLDTDGEPVAGASVALTPQDAKQARGPVVYGQTNDLGEYRLYNVAPGKYLVAATYEPYLHGVVTRLARRPGKSGQAPPPDDYVTTYYPSTLDAAQATTVPVSRGSPVHGIEIRLQRASVVRVRGKVLASGEALSPITILHLSEVQNGSRLGRRPLTAMAWPDGTFEFDGVRPGRYLLQCDSGIIDKEGLRGKQRVEVGYEDVEGIQLTLSPPQKIHGKVVVEGQATLPSGLHAILVPREEDATHQAGGLASIKGDGVFVLDQVYEGRYDFTLQKFQDAPDDFYVRAVQFGDQDALDDGLEVHGQAAGKLEVVMRDDGGTLECKVVSAKGEPVEGAHVTVVPEEPRRRALALFGEARTDENGQCKITGMAPGAYRAFAFEGKQEIDVRQAEGWKAFEKFGKQVRLEARQRVQLELKVVPPEP